MARQIFIVEAKIVDANGTLNNLNGYPAVFDSRGYNGDINKAQKRAEGSMAEAWGAMCKVDTRQCQTVMLYTVDGFLIEKKSMGEPLDPVPQAPEQEEP